jgi:nucleotide-binding universal stress UspA family protein
MITDLLVCLEGSASGDAAARLGMVLARSLSATLSGLAVVNEPDIRAGAPVGMGRASFGPDRDDVAVAAARKHAAERLAAFERRGRFASIDVRTIEAIGEPTETILAEADKHDLTVLGREANFRPASGADDPTIRDAILQRATRPILVVPAGAAALGSQVVIAYDGSPAVKRAVASFAASGLHAGREIRVATVDDNGAAAWELAFGCVSWLKERGIAATPHNLVSPLSNVDTLCAFVEETRADLLVMGCFARSRLKHLLQGSVTRGIFQRTRIPLYLQP